ncbi:MAG: hypothetical protein KBT32_05430 [Bacteroidales bacterium]|nr:hypothetical protein [Candidatus Physcocola equi]
MFLLICLAILLVANWFKPFVIFRITNMNVACKVLKPRILCSTMPMLYTFGNIDDVACMKSDGRCF